MYLLEANLNLLTNASTAGVAWHHLEQNLTAIGVGPLVLLRERNTHTITHNYGDVCQQMQNARRVKSAMIQLTGRTAFLRFYEMMSG